MICVYPIEIEAVDEDWNPVFKLRTFDENCATLTVGAMISPSNIDEFCQALQKALALLELEKPNGKPNA